MNGNGVWKLVAVVALGAVLSLSGVIAASHIRDGTIHEDVDAKHARIDARLELKLDPIKQALERIETRLEGL